MGELPIQLDLAAELDRPLLRLNVHRLSRPRPLTAPPGAAHTTTRRGHGVLKKQHPSRTHSPRRSMSATRALQMNHRQRRTLISSLFGLTFLASVLTVSASAILPCPADRGRYADGQAAPDGLQEQQRTVVVERKPRRWIEETKPVPRAPYPPPPSSNAQP
ncbi:hypothetical protein C2E23DRAFT_902660 [Lenzites betulinus]|nr:hypothetical protein C2E23DRAFT_902660 [Lenzites betulinus]